MTDGYEADRLYYYLSPEGYKLKWVSRPTS